MLEPVPHNFNGSGLIHGKVLPRGTHRLRGNGCSQITHRHEAKISNTSGERPIGENGCLFRISVVVMCIEDTGITPLMSPWAILNR